MAKYSNVKLPAFYIPFMDYQQSLGNIIYKDDPFNDIHLLNPTKTHKITPETNWWDEGQIQYDIDFKNGATANDVHYASIKDSDGYIYIFILGHNFGSTGVSNGTECSLEVQLNEEGSFIEADDRVEIINDPGLNWAAPTYNGFSIF